MDSALVLAAGFSKQKITANKRKAEGPKGKSEEAARCAIPVPYQPD